MRDYKPWSMPEEDARTLLVEGFKRVAATIAEQDDLSHELKRELVVRAYAARGERLVKGIGSA